MTRSAMDARPPLALFENLHDVAVNQVHWLAGQRRLELVIQDLNANFEGLPDDPGRCPGEIVLIDVLTLRVDVELTESGLMVFEAKLDTPAPGILDVTIAFSPAGRITARCGSVEWLEVRA